MGATEVCYSDSGFRSVRGVVQCRNCNPRIGGSLNGGQRRFFDWKLEHERTAVVAYPAHDIEPAGSAGNVNCRPTFEERAQRLVGMLRQAPQPIDIRSEVSCYRQVRTPAVSLEGPAR